MTTWRPLAALLLLALLANACGGGDADDDSTEAAATEGDATEAAVGPTETTTTATAGGGAPDAPSEEEVTEAPAGTATSAVGAEGTFPRTITHTYGETVIPEAPERVVTVGLRDQDAVLAVGITPVGIREWFGEQPSAVWPWAQDELGEAEPTVLDAEELDFEVIAGLDPDVIIGVDSGMTEVEYDTLSGIAPTVAQPEEHPDFAIPWRERTVLVAEALGRTAQAEQVIADVEATIAEAAAAHPAFAEATALVGLAGADGQAYAYGSDDVRSRLLVDLGFTIPEQIDAQIEEGSFFVTLSPENLGQLDADVLVWIGGDATAFEDVVGQPLYPTRVAEEGRDLFLPYDPLGGAMSFASALSLPFLVEELVPELELALDGDPATASDLGR